VHTNPSHRKHKSRQSTEAFTLVEVLIAGVLMTAVLTSVARFSTLAMAGSNHQKERQAIEASINDNIQLIQQADSQITVNRLLDDSDDFFDNYDLSQACGSGSPSNNAASFLMTQLLNSKVSVSPPELSKTQSDYSLQRNFSIINVGSTYMLKVEYQFDGPEENVDTEYRIIEISPSFEAGCYQ
jgi:type II secretory pathway pseudopilin PulG